MIYLLEDEPSIRNLVEYTLKQSGFEIMAFADNLSFWQGMKNNIPSLVLLDIMMPDEDGLSILKKIRANPETSKIPVMMLTAKDSEYDKVVGLDMGADDYLPKPFGMMELVARVKNLLKRTNSSNVLNKNSGKNSEEMEFIAKNSQVTLVLNSQAHKVCVTELEDNSKENSKEIVLTLKEFDVLEFLMKNKGIVLNRDRIMSAVWGYDFDGESRTVDVHIRTLRSKLGVAGEMIKTMRGVGYKID